MNAEIIAIGSELLTPYRQDTNSLYLTEKLNQLGVEVVFKTIVGDRREHLVAAAKLALARADIVVFSGGLGPTEDDLTRESVAQALGLGLRRDPDVLDSLEKRFAARGWQMSSNNAKQAEIIDGAVVLPNGNGTAPGQWISGKYDGCERILLLLPGPPHELQGLFEQQCEERLRERLPVQFIADSNAPHRANVGISMRCSVGAHLQALQRCADHDPRGKRGDPAAPAHTGSLG